ncbi:hypothetical protein EHW67_06440 [Arenibacter aquaticus]|uniref:Galactose oxidase n=1 Tax=Arenibacter aquaticus TaxID=2489054 RepID=A0A3S0APJ4_9FLAO|nr:kelch repeat-containing protein [Arenibacter aquaticus]RTE54800.1 hypothetical protein EHW67_06440 [Arenibacter aquaticus]
MKFDPFSKKISLTADHKTFDTSRYEFKTNLTPELFFGKHGSIIDVPSMAIKNLIIKEGSNKFQFNFHESEGNTVYDANGKGYGTVQHPNWLINDSYHWKHRFKTSSKLITSLAFDELNQRFIYINSDTIGYYEFGKDLTKKRPLKNRFPVPMNLGTSFLNSETNELIVYEVNDLPNDSPTIASVSLENLKTEILSQDQLAQQRHHHNLIWDNKNNRFIIFGGFGNQRLNNTFNAFDLSSKTWDTLTLTGDTISPRFFSGMVQTDPEEVLLFGGVGNESGDQSIGKKYYYDCYRINFEKGYIKKLWEINRNQNLASVRNMVLSADSTSFYTLNYSEYIPDTYLQMARYDIKHGKFEILGDSVPILSERIKTNANLYFNHSTNEFFCTVQEFDIDGSNTINIFSLNNPPVSKKMIAKYTSEKTPASNVWAYILLGIFLILLISWYLIKKWNNNKKEKEKQIKSIIAVDQSSHYTGIDKNSISLFGPFTVFDPKGKDITHLFSNKIRQLFVLILIHSWKKVPLGIISEEINNILWPDKEPKKVKNTKNVAINQLRKTLMDMKDLEVVYNQGLFSISYGKEFQCDYFDFIINLNSLNQNVGNSAAIERLIYISKKGTFLKSFNHPYFDQIKTDFEHEIIKIIPDQIKHFHRENEYSKVVQLADILSNIEQLNEFSFYYKIHSYIKLGLTDRAKKYYNKFVIEYKKVLDDDFPYTFNEVSENIPSDLK